MVCVSLLPVRLAFSIGTDTYQIYVDDMQPDGIGALYVAFEQLKVRLESEGLFAATRKRPLPPFPRRIGVVTSPTGAVIRADVCSTLQRRYPHVRVILHRLEFQGPTAVATLVRSLERLVEYAALVPIDAIIVARGGGSLEELWPFNEEVLARAIWGLSIPVISAVGHETNFTIADFVADLRAATPTAAELVAPMGQELRQYLRQSAVRAEVSLNRKWTRNKRLATLERTPILHDPARIVRGYGRTRGLPRDAPGATREAPAGTGREVLERASTAPTSCRDSTATCG